MPKTKHPTKRRKLKPLTHDQVNNLARAICRDGDDASQKSAALLLLMDEIERSLRDPLRIVSICETARNEAFLAYCLHDSETIDAQADLLRSEIATTFG